MLEGLKNMFTRSLEKDGELEALLKGAKGNTDSISKADALNIPAVGACVAFIANTIAGLPIRLYKREAGKIVEIEDDARLKMLNGDTGDLLDSNQLVGQMVTDMLLNGAGYAYVDWLANKVKGIYYVDDAYVSVTQNADPIYKTVEIYVGGKRTDDFRLMRLTRDSRNGVSGCGVLQQYPLLFNTMLNALRYENNAISTGTKRGFFKSKYKLEPKLLQALKDAWRNFCSTEGKASPDAMILNEGIDFEPASSTATENQLNESKTANSELVYNAFGLSINLFKTTTPNDSLYQNAVKTSILPIIRQINTALNKFLLLEREKDTMFFVVDTSEILRSSLEERYKAYDIALKSGWIQVDEVRKAENLSPLDLNFVKLNLSDVLYNPKTKELYVTNTNASFKLGSNKSLQEGGEGDAGGDES